MATPPFIVNLLPPPDETDTGLTNHIRFSVRDAETYIVPAQIRLTVGYAQARASGTQLFDEVIARTTRTSTLAGTVNLETQPTFALVAEGVEITKTLGGVQQSVYLTSLDIGAAYKSILGMAVVTPGTITNGEPGAIFGLENGPRNTGVYLHFERDTGTPRLRMCGPADSTGARVPNTVIATDWTGTNSYIFVWNEVRGMVELYLIESGATTLLQETAISTFQAYDPIPGGTTRRGGAGDVSMVYGVEGQVGESATFGNVAVTTDVGFPIHGLTRTGEFLTIRRTDETIRYPGGDPLKQSVSPWFGPDDTYFDTPDSAGSITVLTTDAIRLTKLTSGNSFALYREEPSLLGSDDNGFMVEGSFYGITSQLISSRITGMGFVIFDGQSVFYLALLSGSSRTIGLLRGSGSPLAISAYQTPSEDLDWGSYTYFRFVMDPRREVLDLYGDDIQTPLMTIDFDRAELPTAADFGFTGLNPFVSFGHIDDLATLGSFELERLTYACYYQSYEAVDEFLPNEAGTNPIWTSTAGGFAPSALPSPLYGLALFGGGFGILPVGLYIGTSSPAVGTATIEDGSLEIDTGPGVTHTYSRSLAIDLDRGATVEFRLQITRYKPRTRSGYYVMIDDGLFTYALSFVDTEIGKFVGVPLRSGSGLVESVGTEGEPSRLSVKVRWDEPHIYRLERRPLDGLYLFIDNDPEPALVILESARVDFPISQFIAPTVAFGHLSGEGCASLTDFMRVTVSEGYEISTKKVDTTAQLEQDIRNTQAIVITFVEDNDP